MSHVLHKTEDWHEDMGDCLFFSFPNFEEPPYVMVTSPLSTDFDEGTWTHFVRIL